MAFRPRLGTSIDRKSTRLNSSHLVISYAVFCLKKKNKRPTLLPRYRIFCFPLRNNPQRDQPMGRLQARRAVRSTLDALSLCVFLFFFFFNDAAPTEISPLPPPAALPI